MKTKTLSTKWLMLLAVALVLLAAVFAFTLNTGAAELEGMSFTATDCYKMEDHVMPNGSITLEAEIYLPDEYHTARGGGIISNYDGGTYTNAYSFEMMTSGNLRVYSQTHGDVTLTYDITSHMGTNSAPQYAKIAVTVDTSTGAIVLYVNGVQVETATNTSSDRVTDMYNTSGVAGSTTGNTLCIGTDTRTWATPQYFKGKIKNLAMYAGVRSATQVAADHAASFYDTTDTTLLFAYDLTQARDGFIEDQSANLNHAHNTNWTTSEGRAFSSSDDILYPAKDYTEAPLTYEALVWAPMSQDRPGVLIGNYPNASGDCINFEIYSGGLPSLYIYENGALKTNYKFNYDIRRNAFVHLVVTQETVYNETTKVNDTLFTCYVDGEAVDTYTVANYVFTMDMADLQLKNPISLGRDVRTAQVYKGRIKNIALHNRALTAAEVKDAYENGATVNSNSFIAYYDMTGTQATSAIVTDASGNGYDMRSLFYEKDFTTEDYDYSFAVVGDTQFMMWQDAVNGTNYTDYIYNWIVDNYDAKKMKYVFGLGDIIDNGKLSDGTTSSASTEWAHAKELITSTLGVNNIPYSLIGGNHDFMRPYDTGFQSTFGGETTLTKNITGYYVDGEVYNYYMNFEVEGTPYMLLALEYGANDDILAWANGVIEQNRHRRVIITTHGYMNYDGTTLDGDDYAAPKPTGTTNENYLKYNNGDEMWDEMVKKHANVIMVLSGHIDYNNVVVREDTGDKGNSVHQFLIDPQAMDKTYSYQTGMVAMFYFRNGGKDVSVEYVSTYKTANNSGKEVLFRECNQLDFTITEAPEEADKGEINVWLIGGQSNAAGYGQGLSAEQALDSRYTNGFDNVLYYGYSERWQTGFTPVKAGFGYTSSTSGAELGIAEILGNTGEMNAVIKYAQGATALYPVTTGDAAINYGTWTSPSYISKYSVSTDGNKTGLLYVNFINTVKSAIAELERMGYTPVIKGMWWMQGEEETYNGGASSYAEMLTLLSGDIRTDLGAANMPFIVGKVYTPSDAYADLSAVQEQQTAFASSDTYADIVDPTAYANFAQHDNWHFDAATQGYLGRSFIEKACAINGDIIVRTSNNNVTFTGGGLYPKTSTENITVGIAVKDDTTQLASVSKIVGSGTAQSVTLADGKYTFALSGESVTFDVSLDLNDVTTKYGTIPSEYTNENSYPLVVFKDGGFIGAYATWVDATYAAQNAVSGEAYLNSEAQILLRRDFTNTNNGAPASICAATNIRFDLGGFTFTNEYTGFDLVANYPANPYTTKITITNGTLLEGMIAIIDTQIFTATDAGEKRFEITFDALNIGISESAASTGEFWGDLLHTAWTANASTCGVRTVMCFNDCTIDLSGYTRTDKNMVVFNSGDENNVLNTEVKIMGGKLITADLSIITLFKGGANDSMVFGEGADGKLTTLEVVGDNAPFYDTFKTADGGEVYFAQKSDSSTEYSLIPNDAVTAYGTIPNEYRDTQKYPFIVFRNNSFVGAYASWGIDATASALHASKEAGSGSVILMRRDFTNPAGTQYNNLSQTYDLTVDLGGFTFDSRYRAMFYAQKKTTNDTTITVKNGNVLLGSHGLIALNTWNPATVNTSWGTYTGGNGFIITYDTVNISLISGATTANLLCYDAFDNDNVSEFLRATFKNCTLDVSKVDNAITLFDMSNVLAEVTATIDGGKMITAGQTVTFADMTGANANSSFAFTKTGSAYTTLTLPVAATAPTAEYNGLVFIKVAEDGANATYRLAPKAAASINFTPKTSITLDSNLILNVYIPENQYLTGFTLNGSTYTPDDITANGGKFEITLDAKTAAKEITLVVSFTVDSENLTATYTLSTLKYAKKVLEDTNATANTKILVCDMLAYIKSAYTYFGSADATTVGAAIDGIIGADYSNSVKEQTPVKVTDGLDSATFVLDSTPAVRFYLSGDYTADLFTFKVGGAVAEKTVAPDGSYIDVSLYAYKMCGTVEYTISGTDINGSFNLQSYYDYVRSESFTADNKADVIDVTAKFYIYCQSALAYREEVINPQ